MYEGNKFKNSSGTHLLKPLFYELDEAGRPNALYTLKDYDSSFEGKLYPSLRRLFVECEDPTEYSFATVYLDGWSHWKKLSTSAFFQSYVSEWREELEVRLRAKGIAGIKLAAVSNGKDALTAQKFLANGQWKTQEEKSTVGRPTKEKITQEAEKMFKAKTEFDEDHERLFGKMN